MNDNNQEKSKENISTKELNQKTIAGYQIELENKEKVIIDLERKLAEKENIIFEHIKNKERLKEDLRNARDSFSRLSKNNENNGENRFAKLLNKEFSNKN